MTNPLTSNSPDTASAIRPSEAAKAGIGLRTADWILWLLVAVSPIVFGALTWRLEPVVTQHMIRHFSVPIVTIEMLVILFAVRNGFGLKQAFAGIPAWAKIALAILGAVAVGTAVTATADPFSAKMRTITSLLHVLFGLSLVFLFSDRWRQLRPMIWPSIVLGTLGYLALVTAWVASIDDPYTFEWLRFYLAVTNARQLGFYSMVGGAAAFGLAIMSRNDRARWAWLAATGALLALSFWSGTRSSLFAFVGAIALSALVFRDLRTEAAARALAIALLFGFCLGILHTVPHPDFGPFRLWAASGGDDPGSGRLEIWLGTLSMVPQSPWFGFGESQFRSLVIEGGHAYNHPHNWFLQILFQWGIVGAACYFALAAFVLCRFYRSARGMGTAALPAFLVAINLLICSLYEGTLYHPYPISMLLLALAWTIAFGQRSDSSVNLGLGDPRLPAGAASGAMNA